MSHFLKSTTTKGPFRQYIYAVEKEKYLYNTPVTSVNLAFFLGTNMQTFHALLSRVEVEVVRSSRTQSHQGFYL